MELIGFIVFIVLLFLFFQQFKTKKEESFQRSSETPQSQISSNIPDHILEKQFDEVVDEFVDGNLAKKFKTNLLLKKRERLIFDIPEISLCEERSVRMKGGYQGFSVRIMKGVSYRFGGFEGSTEKKIIQLDSGHLILTNKRMVYSGEKISKDIPLNKINTIDAIDNGISITRSGKQKTEYYIGTDVLEFNLTVSPSEGESFHEETLKWKLSGIEIKNIIQKLLQES